MFRLHLTTEPAVNSWCSHPAPISTIHQAGRGPGSRRHRTTSSGTCGRGRGCPPRCRALPLWQTARGVLLAAANPPDVVLREPGSVAHDPNELTGLLHPFRHVLLARHVAYEPLGLVGLD